MYPTLATDLQQLEQILLQTTHEALSILNGLDERPVASVAERPARRGLDDAGKGFAATLEEFNQRYAGSFSASAGPRYLGFVTGGATPAALAGDWLVSTYDQNPTSSLDTSAPELERETVACLRELFGLSAAHQGAFVSGATMSNLVGLAIGREWIGEQRGVRVAEQGLAALGPVRILSGAPHSSIYKVASVLGLGRSAIETLPLLPGREAIDLAALEARLAELSGEACIVVGNAGTVNTVDFDDLAALAALRERYPFWLHVDAAFGAFAALSPRHQAMLAGLDLADSICIDAHKWLNVPYDSAVQFSRRRDLQLRIFMNAAAYLGDPGDNPEFVHLTPENSRRLRALPSWFALRAYGRAGIASITMQCCEHAETLGGWIAAAPEFELLAPIRMNVVCYTLRDLPTGPAGETAIQNYLQRVRESGETFVTPTVYKGRWAIRATFSNWRTRADDVSRAWQALRAAAGI